MAIDPKTLHPTVWKEVDRLIGEGYWGAGLVGAEQAAISDHNYVWTKEYGPGCAIKSAAVIATVGAIIGFTPESARSIVAMPAIVIGLAVFGFFIWQNFRQITPNELKALAPALHLTPIQKQYVEAVLLLEEISLADESKAEVVQQLNRLMDEEVHLRKMREKSGLTDPVRDLSFERAEIVKSLTNTTDPITRETLSRSLEICDGRIAAATEKSVVVQRIDSQLTMISQSMGNMRDMLGRLHSAPMNATSDLDLSPLRQAIENAQSHASALESAVNEIESVGH